VFFCKRRRRSQIREYQPLPIAALNYGIAINYPDGITFLEVNALCGGVVRSLLVWCSTLMLLTPLRSLQVGSGAII
jgi:hypothetical protein